MWLVYVQGLVPVLLGRVQDCGWEWLRLERRWSEDYRGTGRARGGRGSLVIGEVTG